MEGFQSNLELDKVKNIDSLFVLLRFNLIVLLQLSTALITFCKAFSTGLSELAVDKTAYVVVITCVMLLEFS